MIQMNIYRCVFITVFILSILNGNNCLIKLYDRNFNFKLYSKEISVTNLDNNKVITIPAESPLSLAAVRSGMRLSFQCKQGVCSSCETYLNGIKVRTCITKVPSDKPKITIKKVAKN